MLYYHENKAAFFSILLLSAVLHVLGTRMWRPLLRLTVVLVRLSASTVVAFLIVAFALSRSEPSRPRAPDWR